MDSGPARFRLRAARFGGRVAASRNDDGVEGTPSHSRGAISRPGLAIPCPSSSRGRRECRALDRTRNPRGLKRKTPTSRQAGPKSHGTPCAMVLRRLPALAGVPGLLASVAPGARPGLDPSVGGPRPRDLTVRSQRASSHAPEASIATRLTSGDDWPNVPL